MLYMQIITSFIYRMINSRTYRTYHFHISSSQPGNYGLERPKKQPYIRQWLMKQNWLQYLLHIAIWSSLYFLPLLQFTGQAALALYPAGNSTHLLSFCLLISFAYLNYHWMVPELYIKKEFTRYFTLSLIFLTPIAGASLIITPAVILLSATEGATAVLPGLRYSLVLFAASLILPIIIRLQQTAKAAENHTSRLQLSVLNAQIKPHFLFNALNWIYLLSLEQSAQTPNAILQLSGMMRYMLHEADEDFTDLKKELAYINNYIELQKGRLDNTVLVKCALPVYKGYGKIAPLLLMSFIENAFKYGVNPEEDSAIHIDVSITGKRLCLQVINDKVSPSENILPGGLGIANARQRLQLLYPAAHQLEILEDRKIYSVKLLIEIL